VLFISLDRWRVILGLLLLASDQELHMVELADEDLRGLVFAEDPKAQVML
jgi:hypothetical protein